MVEYMMLNIRKIFLHRVVIESFKRNSSRVFTNLCQIVVGYMK